MRGTIITGTDIIRRYISIRKILTAIGAFLIFNLFLNTDINAENKIKKGEGKMADSQLTATINTTKGDIRLKLFPDKAPLTVLNFVNLSKRGFYNSLHFHRVIPNFMIQGDVLSARGQGARDIVLTTNFQKI